MTMREGPRVQTRLSLEEHLRFNKHLIARKSSVGQLARDAIIYYLDKLDKGELEEKESLLEKRVKRMEDRLAGLMARANIDVGVILTLMYKRMNKETRDEEMKSAQRKSAQRLRKKIELQEQFEDQDMSKTQPTNRSNEVL